MKTAGIVILIVGLLMTLYTGFTYVTKEKVLEVGDLKITKDDQHTISWQPYVGIATMVIGGVILVASKKKPLAVWYTIRMVHGSPPRWSHINNEGNPVMLYTIAVVLVVLWLVGLVSSYTMGGFIHILLVIAIVVVLINVINGRRALWLFTGLRRKNQDEGLSMSKSVSLALLAGGILLLFFGIIAYDSSSSDISRFFTGSATDKSILMLVGGVLATVMGLGGLWRVSRKTWEVFDPAGE
jgi:hypothetical protein